LKDTNLKQVWSSAQEVMEGQSKLKFAADIDISFAVGNSNAAENPKIEVVYEVDYAAKKAYIVANKFTGNQCESSELYYGNYASYAKYGNRWVRTPMPVDEFMAIFAKKDGFNLTGIHNLSFDNLALVSDNNNAMILTSSEHPANYAKALLDRVNVYGTYNHTLNNGTVSLEIDKATNFVNKLTIEADGKFGTGNQSQNFKESSVVCFMKLPDDYNIQLPEAVAAIVPGIENLSLQNPGSVAMNCSCTGCTACLSCLACLACISCLFPPLLAPAAATAVLAAVAAAVSLSTSIATQAQTS